MHAGDAIRRLRKRPALGFAIALAVFLAAFGLRYSFSGELYNVPFITLLPAILISALIGGVWVGAAVAALSAIAAWIWFLPPSATTALRWPDGYLTWALFGLTCFVQLYVIHLLNKTVDDLSRARDSSAALFQELQHRVANNLQFVAAMLRMKRRVLELDPASGERLFESAQSRLDAMARIHRRLYSPETLEMPVEEFFRGLCTDILAARGVQNVKCEVASAEVKLDLQQLVALGLLINEFVTNAAKHAFAGRDGGTITVTLQPHDGKQLALTVKDDGCGIPAGVDLANGKSLGMRIMNSLAVQLGGELFWDELRQGTAARLIFPMGPAGAAKSDRV
jgi:two-component sensor histidine kinase